MFKINCLQLLLLLLFSHFYNNRNSINFIIMYTFDLHTSLLCCDLVFLGPRDPDLV